MASDSLSLIHATALVVASASIASVVTYYLLQNRDALSKHQRRHLPRLVLLVRHGESEANADQSLYQRIPDNLLGLTENGKAQADAVGKKVEQILQQFACDRVHLVVSPFERTLQTAATLRRHFQDRIVRTEIESRIREQEVGNLQDDEFLSFRKQQQKVGRFWYRFPTGESGADVLDRVKSWWFESILTVNHRFGYPKIDAIVVVTHGLTMRHILMQLFAWSPTTFHSVWNADNCDCYVLKKDLSKLGQSPYVLDRKLGDEPRSSIKLLVEFKDGKQRRLTLEKYLSVPPPRTTRIGLIKCMLAEQKGIDPNEIESILFMPFVEGGVIKGRSTSGVSRSLHDGLETDSRCCCESIRTLLVSEHLRYESGDDE